MEKINISQLGMTLYKEILPNGLSIYVLPNEKAGNIHTTFSTRFGSFNREFIPYQKENMTKVPAGIAHFLEHKMFEQENGVDPFTFYEERGTDANANTTFYKTTYLFTGPNHFKENMTYLLDYVQAPYFTDENVENEKGIIEQEIKMVADSPYADAVDLAIKNCFSNHPLCDTVLGKIKDIHSITKEDLYDCYNTFYQPSNMFVVITGKVNPEEAIEIIRKNQDEKQYSQEQIIQKEYSITSGVLKKEEILEKNITIPKLVMAYKIDLDHLKEIDDQTIDWAIEQFLEIKFGITSTFSEKVKQFDILLEELEYVTLRVKSQMIVLFIGDTSKIEELIHQIDQELQNKKINELDFNSKKKKRIADLVYMSDNIYGFNNYIMADIIKYQDFDPKLIEKLQKFDFSDFQKYIDQLSFEHKTIVKVIPKKA